MYVNSRYIDMYVHVCSIVVFYSVDVDAMLSMLMTWVR